MPPAPPPLPPAEVDGHCLVEADADGRITWLLPRGTPDSHALRLLTAGVAVVRLCGFEAPPGEVCMGTWPPDVLHLPLVEDPGDAVEDVDPGWLIEVSDALAAAGGPRPVAGEGIVVLTPGPEGPFPGPREVLSTAGNAGLIVFRGGRNCPGDGIGVQLSTSKGIGILGLQGAVGARPQVLKREGLRMMRRVEGFDSGAFAPWPLWPAAKPVAVVPGDATTGPTAFTCFLAPDAERTGFAFESVCAAGDGPLPPFPETPS